MKLAMKMPVSLYSVGYMGHYGSRADTAQLDRGWALVPNNQDGLGTKAQAGELGWIWADIETSNDILSWSVTNARHTSRATRT